MSKTFIIIYYSNKQLLIKITNQNKKSENFLTESEIRLKKNKFVLKIVKTKQNNTDLKCFSKKGKSKGRKNSENIQSHTYLLM